MVNLFFFILSQQEETTETLGQALSSHGGWGWWSCAAFPQQRLCGGTWPLCTAATAARCRSGTKGWRVMNLFAPGSFFKCSNKSLFTWKSWKVWLLYEFNFEMKTLGPFPSNTHTEIDRHAYVWWLGLSLCSPDLCVEPVTHRDTTTVFLTLLSQGHTTVAHRCLGKGQACRTVSKSPGTADRVKEASTFYLTTARLQSGHRWDINWDNPNSGTSTWVGKLKAKWVTCSCCILLLRCNCGSCRYDLQRKAWELIRKRHAMDISKWCTRRSTGLGIHGVSQGGAGSSP